MHLPVIVEANKITVLRLIPNCMCVALRPVTMESKRLIEDLMPEE